MTRAAKNHKSDNPPPRLHRYVLAAILFLVLSLTATQVFWNQPAVGNPKLVFRTFQLWTVTALVIMALLILATILGRNLIKLYFERRSGQVGSRFKTKLVRIFVALSLLPAVLLFALAYYLVSGSIDRWFNAPEAELQKYSAEIAQQYYAETAARAQAFAATIASRAGAEESLGLPLRPGLDSALEELRELYRIDNIRVYNTRGALTGESGKRVSSQTQDAELANLVSDALRGHSDFQVQRISPGDALKEVLRASASIRNTEGRIIGAVLTETLIPNSVHFKAQSVVQAYNAYTQLQREKSSVRFNFLLILALCTLLIVFAFSWFGMYLAKRITVPIQALAEGAAAVAAGNLDYRVQCRAFDEFGSLVTSFNRMTADLQENKANIEAAQMRLRQQNVELDDRRRYMETILQAIATGVVVLDGGYSVRTMNQAAVQMLETQGQSGEMKLDDIVKGPARDTLRVLLQKSSVLGPVIRELELQLQGKTLHLAVTVTPLVGSSEQRTGWVIVLDDLTELLRAEKMAAWQEVARRLAHEIKNPLTPIHLSAERILHRFRQLRVAERSSGLSEELWNEQMETYGRLVAECVQTIIQEADSLQTLVNEFSNFARLPGIRPEDADLHRVLENALSLYNGRIRGVRIERIFDAAMPIMRFDTEQMKRVFINLFDNALEAMADNANPRILRIRTRCSEQQRSVRIEISDTGRGLPKEYEDSLFLPYFSTRRGGTGLGLAIVRQVVSDHNGQVRAEPNVPLGTRIVIDLPLASS